MAALLEVKNQKIQITISFNLLKMRGVLSHLLDETIFLASAFELRLTTTSRNRLLNYATRKYTVNDITPEVDIENAQKKVKELCDSINKLLIGKVDRYVDTGDIIMADVVSRDISTLLTSSTNAEDAHRIVIPPNSEAKIVLDHLDSCDRISFPQKAHYSLYVMELSNHKEPCIILESILLYVY